VRIDFCEADVLDVFDEWRRATGITQSTVDSPESTVDSQESTRDSQESTGDSQESTGDSRQSAAGAKQSLPAHLQRVLLRLTAARTSGAVGPEFDDLIDRVARELEQARADARGVRGERRRQLVDRLAALDRELLEQVRGSLADAVLAEIAREAESELAPFKAAMAADAFSRAREAAIDRLVRGRHRLPIIAFV
jgi:hypothetical protein